MIALPIHGTPLLEIIGADYRIAEQRLHYEAASENLAPSTLKGRLIAAIFSYPFGVTLAVIVGAGIQRDQPAFFPRFHSLRAEFILEKHLCDPHHGLG